MFHYVFFDPAIIDEAVQYGEMGLGRLVELLNDFRRDVFLAETDAWRVDAELGDRVRAIPKEFQNERKKIENALSRLRRHSPLVLLVGDSDPDVSLLEFARSSASDAKLDMILSPGNFECHEGETWIKVSLAGCHNTSLSQRRADLALGQKFDQGDANFTEVANECFEKLVRHAKHVKIYDYALGKYYGNDQPINLKRLIRFLRDSAPGLSELEIHTEPKQRASLNKDVEELRNEVDFKIILKYSSRNTVDSDMPHPRYFGADKRFLDIDLGIDLCDAHNRCKKIHIKYSSSPG